MVIETVSREDTAMPTKGTPWVAIRAPRSLIDELDEVVRQVGTDRSDYLRQFIRWATRQPGAELPARLEESIPAQS